MTNVALFKTKHVIVVGAGIGGLVSAMLLAHSGVSSRWSKQPLALAERCAV